MNIAGPRRPGPHRPTVVIAGGGVAALEAMLALRALAEERLEIVLVAPEPRFWYRPLAVAEPFGQIAAPHFALDELAQDCAAGFIPGSVEAVDVDQRVAWLAHGPDLPFDALLIATGTRAVPAVRGALTFRGPADAEAFATLLREAEAGAAARIVFAVPSGTAWQLPLYELALLSDAWLRERGVRQGVTLTVVTPEDRPLQSFGPAPSDALGRLLEERAIDLVCNVHPDNYADGVLTLFPRASIEADRVVALPRLEGSPPEGIPRDPQRFIPVDDYCRVRGVTGVYAAGDVTTMPVKQGGLAAQQADAAAGAIAADLGVAVQLEPFRPVLRGLLLTGGVPRYLRTDFAAGTAVADVDPLWWPPAKIVGRYLAPYLAERAGLSLEAPLHGVVPVEVALHH